MKLVLRERILTDVGYVEAGSVVDLPNHIAKQWINQGKARPVRTAKPETATLDAKEQAVTRSKTKSKRTKNKV